ncbi:unnamed protein product [Gulo gulo]|uniref:Uncharacterized protein n=1 Tax=Gulo gulo TaxID=48420 RepID=A0A9X9LF07_GULGU|nr:unnamed protein product [Gulo gulo]
MAWKRNAEEPGELKPRGTWRSATRAGKPRPSFSSFHGESCEAGFGRDLTEHQLAKFFIVFRRGEREAGVSTDKRQ